MSTRIEQLDKLLRESEERFNHAAVRRDRAEQTLRESTADAEKYKELCHVELELQQFLQGKLEGK